MIAGSVAIPCPSVMTKLGRALLLTFAVLAVGAVGAGADDDFQTIPGRDKCERITMKLCLDIPYNTTFYPNLFKHSSQLEAETELNQYQMLINIKCSDDVKFFLCTLYAPVCTFLEEPLPPCRHLCLSAKNGCESLMLKFGFKWPTSFDCAQFPESGMCVGENQTATTARTPYGNGPDAGAIAPLPELECPHIMKILSKSRYALSVANRSVEQCSLPCNDETSVPVFFDPKTRNQLRFWTGLCAVLGCIASGLTLITFLIDLQRFEFPERSIFYVAFCTLVVSGVYVWGMINEGAYSCAAVSVSKVPLVTQGMDVFGCTLLAVTHYFFSTAMFLWWLVLCFSWFLVTTLKWGEAPVGDVFAAYFHIFAWGVPLLLSIAVLVFHGVDGDLFSGICSVGNLKPTVLFNFVFLPQGIALVLGFFLFVVGLISIIRIRSYLKGRSLGKFGFNEEASEKLFRLMSRMTVFALLFCAPAIASLYSIFYQSFYLDSWLTSWYSTRCLHANHRGFGFTQSRDQCPPLLGVAAPAVVGVLASSEPEAVYFFAKHLPFFVAGLACAVWTFNGKTAARFRECWDRQCHRGRSRVPTTADH